METNARYLTIGSFALAVIVAVFGFVLWLNRTTGFGAQDTYQVRFGGSVSGLQPGAAVLFDGMRVGVVSGVVLDPHDPRHVLATIAVASGTPVRQDTVAGIESQGLMGTAAVSLQGGSPSALPLVGQSGEPGTLVADPEAGRSLTDMAGKVLKRVDAILGDNADAIKSTMDSLKSFSGALARNSGKVDGVMAGLERMTGGGAPKALPPIYDLAAPTLSGLASGKPPGQIYIGNPTAVVALQTQRLLTRSPDNQLATVGEMQWSDALPSLIQTKILQSFDDVGLAATLTAPTTFGKDDRQLQIDLRAFNLMKMPDGKADIAFSAKMLSSDGHILGTKVFQAQVPCPTEDAAAAVKALGTAFGMTVGDLALWVSGAT